MAKGKIPTADEVREYKRKFEAERDARIANHEPAYIRINFPNEKVWLAGSTLPLLEAAEKTGTSNEEIWELCSKMARMTHAPVTKKEYERMIPFAQKPKTVDTVLEFLKTYYLNLNKISFDSIIYYYCVALISQSDYRQSDCEQLLWELVDYHIKHDEKYEVKVMCRNMKMLEDSRPYLIPMKEKLEESQRNKG